MLGRMQFLLSCLLVLVSQNSASELPKRSDRLDHLSERLLSVQASALRNRRDIHSSVLNPFGTGFSFAWKEKLMAGGKEWSCGSFDLDDNGVAPICFWGFIEIVVFLDPENFNVRICDQVETKYGDTVRACYVAEDAARQCLHSGIAFARNICHAQEFASQIGLPHDYNGYAVEFLKNNDVESLDKCFYMPPNGGDDDPGKLSWKEAHEWCERTGGELATIHSEQQNEVVRSMFRQQYSDGVWIGARDMLVEGEWYWTDGRSFDYNAWKPGQPDSRGQDCGEMEADGWDDDHCGERKRFVCSQVVRYREVEQDNHPWCPVLQWVRDHGDDLLR